MEKNKIHPTEIKSSNKLDRSIRKIPQTHREKIVNEDKGNDMFSLDKLTKRKTPKKQTSTVGNMNKLRKPYKSFRMDEFTKMKTEKSDILPQEAYKEIRKKWLSNPPIQKKYQSMYDEASLNNKQKNEKNSYHSTNQSKYIHEHITSHKNYTHQPTLISKSFLNKYPMKSIQFLLSTILNYIKHFKTYTINWNTISTSLYEEHGIHWPSHICHYIWRSIAYSPKFLEQYEYVTPLTRNNEDIPSDDDMIHYISKPQNIQSNSYNKVPLNPCNYPQSALYLPKQIKHNSNLNIAMTQYPSLYPLPKLLSTSDILKSFSISNDKVEYFKNLVCSISIPQSSSSSHTQDTQCNMNSNSNSNTIASIHENNKNTELNPKDTLSNTNIHIPDVPMNEDIHTQHLSTLEQEQDYYAHRNILIHTLDTIIAPEFTSVMGFFMRFYSLPQIPQEDINALYSLSSYIHDRNIDPYFVEPTLQTLANMKEMLFDIEKSKILNHDYILNKSLPQCIYDVPKPYTSQPASLTYKHFSRNDLLSDQFSFKESLDDDENSTINNSKNINISSSPSNTNVHNDSTQVINNTNNNIIITNVINSIDTQTNVNTDVNNNKNIIHTTININDINDTNNINDINDTNNIDSNANSTINNITTNTTNTTNTTTTNTITNTTNTTNTTSTNSMNTTDTPPIVNTSNTIIKDSTSIPINTTMDKNQST